MCVFLIKKIIILRYVLFFLLILLICVNSWLFKNNMYIITTIILFIYYIASELFIRKKKLHNVEKYVKEMHIDDVGEYVYWNSKNILLTDNYVFVIINDIIKCYKYDQVKKIVSKFFLLSRGSSYFRKLVFDDDYVIEVHEISNSLNKKFSDIPSFIKEKNSKVENIF